MSLHSFVCAFASIHVGTSTLSGELMLYAFEDPEERQDKVEDYYEEMRFTNVRYPTPSLL